MSIARSGPLTKDTSTVALGLAKILVGKSADFIDTITQVLHQVDDSLGALNSSNFTSTVEYWRLESGFPALEDMSIPLSETAQIECEFKELHPRNLAMARGIDPTEGATTFSYDTSSDTTDGTIDDDVTLSGSLTEGGVYTLHFTSATEFSVNGETGTAGTEFTLTDTFTLPEGYFTGTWDAGDTHTIAIYASGGNYADAHSGEVTLGTMSSPAFVRVEAIYTYPNQINHLYIIFPRANVTSSMNLNFAAQDNANVPITLEAKRADSGVVGGHVAWNNAPLGRIYFD